MDAIRLSRQSQETLSRRYDAEKVSGSRRPRGQSSSPEDNASDDEYDPGAGRDIEESPQAGVQRLEAVASTWSSWSLIAAYAG